MLRAIKLCVLLLLVSTASLSYEEHQAAEQEYPEGICFILDLQELCEGVIGQLLGCQWNFDGNYCEDNFGGGGDGSKSL